MSNDQLDLFSLPLESVEVEPQGSIVMDWPVVSEVTQALQDQIQFWQAREQFCQNAIAFWRSKEHYCLRMIAWYQAAALGVRGECPKTIYVKRGDRTYCEGMVWQTIEKPASKITAAQRQAEVTRLFGIRQEAIDRIESLNQMLQEASQNLFNLTGNVTRTISS